MALRFDTTPDPRTGAFRPDVQKAVAEATAMHATWELSRYATSQNISWNDLQPETRERAADWDLDSESPRDLVDQAVNDMIRDFAVGGITKTVSMDWDGNFADAEPDSAEIMVCGGGPTIRLFFKFGPHGVVDADSLVLKHSWGVDSGVLRFSEEHEEAAAFVAECLTS